MVQTIICESGYETYLKKLSKFENISIGLILGQPSETGKIHIVHLSKTHDLSSTEEDITLAMRRNHAFQIDMKFENIEQIDNSAITNHALNTIRMLPGGFHILGLLVVSPQNIFTINNALNKIRSILLDMEEALKQNEFLYGTTERYNNGNKLILHYSSINNTTICKSFSTTSMELENTDFRFASQEKSNWYLIETFYEIDEIYPMQKKTSILSTVESSLQATVSLLANELMNSVVFFDGEPLNENELIDSIYKKKRSGGDNDVIRTNIYLPYLANPLLEEKEIIKFDGRINYSGSVNSKVWVQGKNTIKEVERYIKEDIIRSLSSRIQFHCQALATVSEEKINQYKSHPPRRVFFPLKPYNPNVQFCDYLFKWETEETTIQQANDYLDLDLTTTDIITSGEVITEDNEFCDSDEQIGKINGEKIEEYSARDMTKLMYLLAIIAAVIVFIISICLHFILE